MMTRKELKKTDLRKIGILLYYTGTVSVKSYSSKLRILHPIGFIYLIGCFIITPFAAIFVRESVQGILKGMLTDVVWW